MTPGVNVINNRVQGKGFPRANKHPVGSTSDYMAAGRTSALMTLGSFKKQSARERQDLVDNANHHCQQACLIMRSPNYVCQESGDWSLERKRMAEKENVHKDLSVLLKKWHKQGHTLSSYIWTHSAEEASTSNYTPEHVTILLGRQFTQLQWTDNWLLRKGKWESQGKHLDFNLNKWSLTVEWATGQLKIYRSGLNQVNIIVNIIVNICYSLYRLSIKSK